MKIVLCMIVKDESHVIERCLDSVKHIVDEYVIHDTGSTDDTKAVITQFMEKAGISGAIHDEPWKNFGHNRSLSVAQAQSEFPADWYLVMDADHIWHGPKPAPEALTGSDIWNIEHRYANYVYGIGILLRGSIPWRYEGAIHELVTSDHLYRRQDLPAGPWVEVRHDGARSKSADTYKGDAKMLEDELAQNPSNPRTQYYLAQSYRDWGSRLHADGDKEGGKALAQKARALYQTRAANKAGYVEERWHAAYRAAQMAELLVLPGVMEEYLRAWQMLPNRCEPLVNAARYSRLKQDYALAAMFAERAMSIPKPAAGLFIEAELYDWQAADEFSVSAHYSGRSKDALKVSQKLLQGRLPDEQRKRIEANIVWYLKAA